MKRDEKGDIQVEQSQPVHKGEQVQQESGEQRPSFWQSGHGMTSLQTEWPIYLFTNEDNEEG